MPIKKTVSASDFGEQQPLDPDTFQRRGRSFALTVAAKEHGKTMTFIIKGPVDKAEVSKALNEGKIPDAWTISVRDSKSGKSYAVNAETLFACRDRRRSEGREDATVKKYAAASQVRKRAETPKPVEKPAGEKKESPAVREAQKPAMRDERMYTAQSGTLKTVDLSSGAVAVPGRRKGEAIAQHGEMRETELAPGAFEIPGKKKKDEGT